MFPRLCNCAVLFPFLHLPHSSLRLEYLSPCTSVYRRFWDYCAQTNLFARRKAGAAAEIVSEILLISILRARACVCTCVLLSSILASVKTRLCTIPPFAIETRVQEPVTLRWPREASFQRCRLRANIRVAVSSRSSFRQYANAS